VQWVGKDCAFATADTGITGTKSTVPMREFGGPDHGHAFPRETDTGVFCSEWFEVATWPAPRCVHQDVAVGQLNAIRTMKFTDGSVLDEPPIFDNELRSGKRYGLAGRLEETKRKSRSAGREFERLH
tara:strand:+ start:3102 stop:3482 length:381 start_codon:yes stop_codon:yes gene_type:complete